MMAGRRGLLRSELTLAILAGGGGTRLGGVAKGLLTSAGISFVDRILRLQPLCAEARLVSSDPAYDRFGVQRIEDVEPGRGAPGGVISALLSSATAWVLVVACDMPFVTLDLARRLIDDAGEEDVTCFLRDGQLEPLFAIYRASMGLNWHGRLGENPALKSLLLGSSLRTLATGETSALDSINTPEQLAAVKR